MKISHINNIEVKLINLMDTLENYLTEEDSEQDKQIQKTIDEKLNEVQALITNLKLNNNSSAAKLEKWLNDNLAKYTLNPEHFKILANENSFTLIVNPMHLNLNVLVDENDDYEDIPRNKEHFDLFNSIQDKEGFNYYDMKNSIKLQDNLATIEKFIVLDSKSDHCNNMYESAFYINFKYTKKLFKDQEAAEEICDEWMKQIINYFNEIKNRMEIGHYTDK